MNRDREAVAPGGGPGGLGGGHGVSGDGVGMLFGAKAETDQVSVAWKSFVLACEPIIYELLDVYMEVVYPL